MAMAASKEAQDKIKVLFHKFQTNPDGCLSQAEFRTVLKAIGTEAQDIEVICSLVTANSEGRIKTAEFLHWVFTGEQTPSTNGVAKASEKEADDDFGAEDGVEKAPKAADKGWRTKSQGPWMLGEEHCTLSILENADEGLMQFELVKSNSTTMTLTLTNAQFDELLAEQKGLSGVAQSDAAIAQLFKEAAEELEKPAGHDDDDFGEDHGEEFAAAARPPSKPVPGPEPEWSIQSQGPWQLGLEHCTLTVSENAKEGLVQFELVRSNGTNMTLTCTNAQWKGLLDEQTGLSGAAQNNAAISQLFREAQEELDGKAKGASRPATENELDEFGEDDEEGADGAKMAEAPKSPRPGENRWQIKSQQPWTHASSNCTLTILENTFDKLVQFELVRLSDNVNICVTCTNAQFDDLLNEQTGLSGTAQVNAALTVMFSEIEMPASS